jgi:hypothetical protein
MNRAGAAVLNEEGLMANETPNDDELAECIAVGKQLAAV